MPELPEVETIVNGLQDKLIGKRIDRLEALFAPAIWLDEVRATGQAEIKQVKALVEGQKIAAITRRGKMIIITLSGETTILVHLKMTGQLIYIDQQQQRYAGGHPSSDMTKELPVKSTRAIFSFKDGAQLFFNDQRKFGYIKIIPSAALDQHKPYANYGPEPLTVQFNQAYLKSKMKNRPKITIKQLLLDQQVVAGVGNIYADEGLFISRIHPATLASHLSDQEIKVVVENIKKILLFSIKHNGTSSEHYVTANGQKGQMQDFLQVYRKHGQACPRCGQEIIRIEVGGRGTHLCPNCQKIK